MTYPLAGVYLITNCPHRDHIRHIITIDERNITVTSFVDSYNDKMPWDTMKHDWIDYREEEEFFTQHATDQNYGESTNLQAQWKGNGKFFKFPPNEYRWTFTGKKTFSLDGMSGLDEITDVSVIDFCVLFDGTATHWRNRLIETKPGKIMEPNRWRQTQDVSSGITLFLPFKTKNLLTDARVHVIGGPPPVMNVEPTGYLPFGSDDVNKSWIYYMFSVVPMETDLTIGADEWKTIQVKLEWNALIIRDQAINKSSKFVVETDCGYLPYRRLLTDESGVGEIKLSALGLKAGDEIKVKIGNEHYTSLGKFIVKVV